ncbi:hypothetical protein VUR80DRAFT_9533 [Thermomyces stellatus]
MSGIDDVRFSSTSRFVTKNGGGCRSLGGVYDIEEFCPSPAPIIFLDPALPTPEKKVPHSPRTKLKLTVGRQNPHPINCGFDPLAGCLLYYLMANGAGPPPKPSIAVDPLKRRSRPSRIALCGPLSATLRQAVPYKPRARLGFS